MDEQQVVSFWSAIQTTIRDICKRYDATWRKRCRILSTQFLVLFIFKLVLSKNKQGYNSTLSELWDTMSGNSDIQLPQEKPIAASSICEARQKMPTEIFNELNKEVVAEFNQSRPSSTWRGHRLFGTDGSKLNLPRELEKYGYKILNPTNQHYPTGLFSTLYNLSQGVIYDFSLESHLDERRSVLEHMKHLKTGDVLILDRGYFSYYLLHESIMRGIHLVCRLPRGKSNKAVTEFWDSNETDIIINYTPSYAVVNDLKKKGIKLSIKESPLRLVKYTIDKEVYVCATTLIGANYPESEFPALYHGRWGLEELYKISKEFIDVEDFHSKSERGVKQELYAHCLLVNLARMLEKDANDSLPPQEKITDESQPKDSYWQGFCEEVRTIKINFKNCLLVTGRNVERLFLAAKNTVCNWVFRAIESIAKVRQKIRPGRHYPRVSHKPINKWTHGDRKKQAGKKNKMKDVIYLFQSDAIA